MLSMHSQTLISSSRLLMIGYLFTLSFTIQAQFITTWKTDNAGISKNNQITIPGKGTYSIVWQAVGDSTNQGRVQGKDTTTVSFPKPGIYQISISGHLQQTQFDNRGDKLKLITIQLLNKVYH